VSESKPSRMTEKYDKMGVPALKKECSSRGISDAGEKSDLVARLAAYDRKSQPADATVTTETLAKSPTSKPAAAPEAPGVSEEEKRQQRAERFGVPNKNVEVSADSEPTGAELEEKKKARAERFGIPNANVEADKKKARAERFGLPNKQLDKEKKKAASSEEAAKRKAREEKFGTVQKGNLAGPKAEKRTREEEKSAISVEEAERIKQRKERFGLEVLYE